MNGRPGTKIKQPWFMAFAGLWERWQSPAGEVIESCTIIVTGANSLMQPIHERMPVILAPEDWEAWLEPENQNPAALQGFLRPYPAEAMTAWPVSTLVNSPRHAEAGCVEALGNRPV